MTKLMMNYRSGGDETIWINAVPTQQTEYFLVRKLSESSAHPHAESSVSMNCHATTQFIVFHVRGYLSSLYMCE